MIPWSAQEERGGRLREKRRVGIRRGEEGEDGEEEAHGGTRMRVRRRKKRRRRHVHHSTVSNQTSAMLIF